MEDSGICGLVLVVCGGRGSTGVMGRWGAGGFPASTSSGQALSGSGRGLRQAQDRSSGTPDRLAMIGSALGLLGGRGVVRQVHLGRRGCVRVVGAAGSAIRQAQDGVFRTQGWSGWRVVGGWWRARCTAGLGVVGWTGVGDEGCRQ